MPEEGLGEGALEGCKLRKEKKGAGEKEKRNRKEEGGEAYLEPRNVFGAAQKQNSEIEMGSTEKVERERGADSRVYRIYQSPDLRPHRELVHVPHRLPELELGRDCRPVRDEEVTSYGSGGGSEGRGEGSGKGDGLEEEGRKELGVRGEGGVGGDVVTGGRRDESRSERERAEGGKARPPRRREGMRGKGLTDPQRLQ